MDKDQQIWRSWASFLQHWGLEQSVASILEAAGPLSVLGAQIVYICSPLLKYTLPVDQLEALARTLEDTDHTQAFVSCLREAHTQ